MTELNGAAYILGGTKTSIYIIGNIAKSLKKKVSYWNKSWTIEAGQWITK